MTRLLVIPAAGRGSRLGWTGPKVLCPVRGRPMIDWLLDRYAGAVDLTIVVAAPDALDEVQSHCVSAGRKVEFAVQEQPAGMLPAILCARPLVARLRPADIWITWCDQVGISARTTAQLLTTMAEFPGAGMVFPTVRQSPPYIHFDRDAQGRILKVRQRREGDTMPPVGESDCGLFGLRLSTFLDDLTAFANIGATGSTTGERNFLPFIPWLASTREIRTFSVDDAQEAVGINTPADLADMERYLGRNA